LGDRFPLFNATSYAGSFSSLTLPPVPLGLAWTNKLLLDGSFEVVSASKPAFTNLLVAGTNLIFLGSGGRPNSNYIVLTATNVSLPIGFWVTSATNKFDSNGNFIFTNAISPAVPQKFYRICLP